MLDNFGIGIAYVGNVLKLDELTLDGRCRLENDFGSIPLAANSRAANRHHQETEGSWQDISLRSQVGFHSRR
jgi:hypothetical protein